MKNNEKLYLKRLSTRVVKARIIGLHYGYVSNIFIVHYGHKLTAGKDGINEVKMFFIDWVSNSEILKQLKILGKQMSENQEKIDALAAKLEKAKAEIIAQIEELKNQPGAEVLDFSALETAAQSLDDLNPDEPVTGTDTAPATE